MADGDLLDPVEWASTGPTSGDLVVRVDALGHNAMGVNDSKDDGDYWAILNHTFNTDNQSVQVILTDPINPLSKLLKDAPPTTIYMHSDSAHTVGSYCRIYPRKIEVGSYTRSGSTYTYTPFTDGVYESPMIRFRTSGRVEFRNYGTEWKVIYNDVEVLTAVGSVTFASNRRSAAVGITRVVGTGLAAFESKLDGFWVYSVVMSDYIPQLLLGSGAKMARTTAGATTATSGADRIVPHFTTTMYNTTDIISDPADAKFTVSVEGWYEIKLYCFPGTSIAAGVAVFPILYVNGVSTEYGEYMNSGAAQYATVSGNWTVYLMPGDEVQAKYNISATTANYFGAGDAAGAAQHFNIVLANRSLL